ncbi:hypothetical protein [Pararhodobacter sp. CCB-MM2]|uniref:hypothetical protein n=1 Tax=Pararhodobacter sp. CCB-MM2 TaxID=1786003 RepID=UPI00082D8961|nr:hypothetical protein [Pararhodobacter sp. CCB-MM2]
MDAELRAELRDTVDDVFAETIRHLPLAEGRVDNTRARVEFQAVLRTGERDPEAPNFGRGDRARPALEASGGHLRIDRLAWPDLHPRKGDKIVALDRAALPVFEIVAVDDRSHLRLICKLGDAN